MIARPQEFSLKTKYERLALWILVATLFVLQLFLARVVINFQNFWVDPPRSKAEKTNPELFKALTFGHVASAVDGLTFNFITDPAYSKINPGERPAAFYDLDLATDVDPLFWELYYYGGNFLTILRNDVEGGRLILEKGDRFRSKSLKAYPSEFKAKYWKHEWAIPLTLAYVYLFELDDLISSEKYYRAAAELPGSPAFLKSLITRFDKAGGAYEVGIRLLNFMISSATTDDAKAKLVKKRDSLFLSQYFFQLNDGFKQALKKLPEYRTAANIRPADLKKWFSVYRKKAKVPDLDPMGGRIFLNDAGEITSTTPRQKVFGY